MQRGLSFLARPYKIYMNERSLDSTSQNEMLRNHITPVFSPLCRSGMLLDATGRGLGGKPPCTMKHPATSGWPWVG
jgi:hypothetical protein